MKQDGLILGPHNEQLAQVASIYREVTGMVIEETNNACRSLGVCVCARARACVRACLHVSSS